MVNIIDRPDFETKQEWSTERDFKGTDNLYLKKAL